MYNGSNPQLLDIRVTLIGIWLDTTHAASMWSTAATITAHGIQFA